MSFWVLTQVFINIVLLAGVGIMWLRSQRTPKDDPRLSRGLQILQSKISVLEDLSDRTETQVNQAVALIDRKIKDLQVKIHDSNDQISKIEESRQRSMEVAQIFQDRIPHQEIVERQNTIKYVKAARMAHQGVSAEEIARHVDLSIGEIEFIAKVNKHQLQFSESDLPDWVPTEENYSGSASAGFSSASAAGFSSAAAGSGGFSGASTVDQEFSAQPLAKAAPKQDQITLSSLGEKFRQTMAPVDASAISAAVAFAPAASVAAPVVAVPMAAPIAAAPAFANVAPIAPASAVSSRAATPGGIANASAAANSQMVSANARIAPRPSEEITYANNARGEQVPVRKMIFPRVST